MNGMDAALLDQRDVPRRESGAALCARGLSKCFRRYRRRADRIKQVLFSRRRYYREFWALRDVSLDVGRGETVGIVGRNGSGKSTLLQMICGTSKPTAGEVEVRGRVAALLELGAGFHPEFTGRDNVYTNAAILGFSEREIDEKFDEIVAFSELEDFIDQPVKTYSSGMYVRLAFSVAISVEPDILVVDEALAVGDAAFQAKCYGRIRAIQRRGGTILFVSHNASAVLELCNRAVLLDRGEVLLDGDPKTVVTRYHKLLFCPPERLEEVRAEVREAIILDGENEASTAAPEGDAAAADVSQPALRTAGQASSGTRHSERPYFDPGLRSHGALDYPRQGAEIRDLRITTPEGEKVNVLLPDEEYLIRYRVRFDEAGRQVRFGSMLKTVRGVEITLMVVPREPMDHVPAGGEIEVEFRFRCLLLPETYFINVGVFGSVQGRDTYLHRITDALAFRVLPRGQRATGGSVDLYSEYRLTSAVPAREAAA